MEDCKATVIVAHNTKTRLSTTLQIGDSRIGINLKIEGFNTHLQEDYNMMSAELERKYFFKLSKKQSRDKYIEYLKGLLEIVVNEILGIKIEQLNIDLIERNINWK